MSTHRNSHRNFAAGAAALFEPETRRAIIDDPRRYAQQAGADVAGKDVVVVKCTAQVCYLPVQRPPEDAALGAGLSDNQLRGVTAAGNTPAGTAGSLGTVGTLCSTYSSSSTVGTAGCG